MSLYFTFPPIKPYYSVILWHENFSLVCNNTLELSKIINSNRKYSYYVAVIALRQAALKTWKALQLY